MADTRGQNAADELDKKVGRTKEAMANFIKACLARSGLNKKEFAAAVDVDRVTVSTWIAGAQWPSAANLTAVLRVIGFELNQCLSLPSKEDRRSNEEKRRRAHELIEDIFLNQPGMAVRAVPLLEDLAGGAPRRGQKKRRSRT